jgi:hypothetical protein
MGLTISQVEMISKELGLPSARWDEADSWVVMALIYAAVEGLPVAEVKALSVGELSRRMVDVGMGDESVDPTSASG